MQKIILLGSLLLLMYTGKAQENNQKITGAGIAGKVTDSLSAKPIEYATITLFIEGNKKPVNGAVTNAEGVYKLTEVDPGIYKIVVECLGYQPFTINNIQAKKALVNLNTVALNKKTVLLQ